MGPRLTDAQLRALAVFEPKTWRGAFPDVNPRSAEALWRLGLVEGRLEQGKRLFRLTAAGERARENQLSGDRSSP